MLILVGVTINVVLNGGLFGKAEEATFKTEVSNVREQLEMAKTLRIMDDTENGYSGITVENLDLDDKTKEKYKNMIVLASNGDVCYDPANVTDEQKKWLEELGIKANTSNNSKPILKSDTMLYTNGNIGMLVNETGLSWLCNKDAVTGLYAMTIFLNTQNNYEYNGTIYQKAILFPMFNNDGTVKEYNLYGYLEDEKVVLLNVDGEVAELTEKIDIEEYYKEINIDNIYYADSNFLNIEGLEGIDYKIGGYISESIINIGVLVDKFMLTVPNNLENISIAKGNKIKVIKHETGEEIEIDLTNKDVIILESNKALAGYYEGEKIIILMLAPTGEENVYMEIEDYPLSNKVVFEKIK